MADMKELITDANNLKGFFAEMVNQGKLIRDENGNIEVNPQYGSQQSDQRI